MSIGQLNTRFAFEQAPVERSATGQNRFDWDHAETFAERWGRFVPKGSREFGIASQQFAGTEWLVECRGRAAVNGKMRIRTTAGQVMEISGIYSNDGKPPAQADMIFVACREVAKK